MVNEKLQLTDHVLKRIQQRSYSEKDINLIIEYGTIINENEYFLKNKNIQRQIEIRKHEIQRLEHLRGSKIVIKGTNVITIYRPSKKNKKKLLKNINCTYR